MDITPSNSQLLTQEPVYAVVRWDVYESVGTRLACQPVSLTSIYQWALTAGDSSSSLALQGGYRVCVASRRHLGPNPHPSDLHWLILETLRAPGPQGHHSHLTSPKQLGSCPTHGASGERKSVKMKIGSSASGGLIYFLKPERSGSSNHHITL